jgi:hypothetical protein
VEDNASTEKDSKKDNASIEENSEKFTMSEEEDFTEECPDNFWDIIREATRCPSFSALYFLLGPKVRRRRRRKNRTIFCKNVNTIFFF